MSTTIVGSEIDWESKTTVEPGGHADWLRRVVQALMMVYLLPVIALVMIAGTALAGLLAIFAMISRAAKWLGTPSRLTNDLPFRPMGSPNLRVNRSERYVPNSRVQHRKPKSL